MIKGLIIVVILICICSSLLTQEFFPFSEEEIKAMANKMIMLEKSDLKKAELIIAQKQQIYNFKEIVKLDSLELNYKNKELELYEERLKKKKVTWWEKVDQHVYFILGFTFALGGSWVVKNVIGE